MMRAVLQRVTGWRVALWPLVLLALAACGGADTGTGETRITVAIDTGKGASAARGFHVGGVLPAELTRILITVQNTQNQTVASGDLLASGGRLTLQVTPGEDLRMSGTAYAGSETLFAGNTAITALTPGESRSVALRLDEMVTFTLTPPAPTVNLGSPVQMQFSLSGLSDTTLRWRVNGVVGGSTEFGVIDSNGLYTP
ncbi:MAG TPA: hypothetical protein ENJ19_07585, partial [Gammaproteobacteria bacterium]|nr:hypothetical protein [Gammaproteobacteria bacterium]